MEISEFSLNTKEGPQAVFVHSPADKETKINLLDTYLSTVDKIEGLPRDEYLRKQKALMMGEDQKVYEEFMDTPEDDKSAKNAKETKRMLFDPNRFYMQKINKELDESKVMSAEGL